MAVLTLSAPSVSSVRYVLSEIQPEYISEARVEIYGADALPLGYRKFSSDEVAGHTSLSGAFGGLKRGVEYRVESTVKDRNGYETSTRSATIILPLEYHASRTRYHSLYLGGHHTYDAWGLIPMERPSVGPPEVKKTIVDIPGSSEALDMSEELTGHIVLGQRTGSWKFYFDPDWKKAASGALLQKKLAGTMWASAYDSLMSLVHGRRLLVVLEDDMSKTYIGRLTVSDWTAKKYFSEVTISYSLDPELAVIAVIEE